jgi:inositol-hexakisphosphate/diphosphoinositol-pentakisphosphate 1-kinase
VQRQRFISPKACLDLTSSLIQESHIYTLINCIFECGIPTIVQRNELQEVDYLTQVSFEVWERTSSTTSNPVTSPGTPSLPTLSTFSPTPRRILSIFQSIPGISMSPPLFTSSPTVSSPGTPFSMLNQNRYSLRIAFSPGCTVTDPLDIQLDSKHCISVAPRRPLTGFLDVEFIKELLEKKFARVELPKRFLLVNLRGEMGRGFGGGAWNSDISDDTSDVGSSVKGDFN